MIGRYFAQHNGIVHPKDRGMVFKDNAESCYQGWQTTKLAAILTAVMGTLLMTAVTIESSMKLDIRSISENFMTVGMDILIVAIFLWGAMRIKNIRKTPKVQMALKWSKHRKTVRYFAERIDLIQVGEYDEMSRGIDHFLYLAMKHLARVTLKIEYDGLTSTHPNEDKLKGNLLRLGNSLVRTIPEGRIFDGVRDELGFND